MILPVCSDLLLFSDMKSQDLTFIDPHIKNRAPDFQSILNLIARTTGFENELGLVRQSANILRLKLQEMHQKAHSKDEV